jgi:hypothetical protein
MSTKNENVKKIIRERNSTQSQNIFRTAELMANSMSEE